VGPEARRLLPEPSVEPHHATDGDGRAEPERGI
jgi:hypothetical protein